MGRQRLLLLGWRSLRVKGTVLIEIVLALFRVVFLLLRCRLCLLTVGPGHPGLALELGLTHAEFLLSWCSADRNCGAGEVEREAELVSTRQLADGTGHKWRVGRENTGSGCVVRIHLLGHHRSHRTHWRHS